MPRREVPRHLLGGRRGLRQTLPHPMHGHRMHAEGFRCHPARVPLVAELQRSGDVHVMLARSPEMLPFGPLADLNSQTSEQPDCAQLADREPDRSPSLGWSWAHYWRSAGCRARHRARAERAGKPAPMLVLDRSVFLT
jgi:hypothetical protein